MMLRMNLVAFALLLPTLCLTDASRAAVVGIDLANNASTYTGPGVLDASSRTWTLKTGNGTFTLGSQTLTLTIGGHSSGTANAAIDLFDDYMFTVGTAFGVVISNLDPTKLYNVVYYGAQNFLGGRGTTFDLAEPNLAPVTTTGDQQSTFVEGVNYVRFNNLAPDNSVGDQRIRVLVGIGPDGGVGIINGFEIQEVAAAPTPAALPAGLAMLTMLAGARRRRAC
ncbi:MAG: hypothetical protein GC162_03470 [Planctomycetes bacterium]|nr:hypothetical protein [Planctomycetota bacterium]